jgi:hypothetical protein
LHSFYEKEFSAVEQVAERRASLSMAPQLRMGVRLN